jgi:hypothetical protein
MEASKEVEKMVMTIKIVWIALSASMVMYIILLVALGKTSMMDVKDITSLKEIIYPVSFLPFIFTLIFSRKINTLIKKTNMEKAPFAKHMLPEDKRTLSYFPAYFIVHVVMWALNEAGAILGFLLSFLSGNIQYYLITAGIALFINNLLLKPNYLKFIKGKTLE